MTVQEIQSTANGMKSTVNLLVRRIPSLLEEGGWKKKDINHEYPSIGLALEKGGLRMPSDVSLILGKMLQVCMQLASCVE